MRNMVSAERKKIVIFFKWNEEYNIGIKEVDEEHMQLVKLLNQLYKDMYAGKGRNALENVLSSLISYTQTHFLNEEKIMISNGYPGYLEHKRIHKKMTEKVLEMYKQFQNDKISSPVQISNFLKNWLLKHIMGTDKKFADFIKEQK